MNIATDIYRIIYLLNVPASVGCVHCSMSLHNTHTQTCNVQMQTQLTVDPFLSSHEAGYW